MALVHDTPRFDTGLGGRITSVLQMAQDAVRRRRVFNTTRRELNALSDRDLADLGMHRSMITEVAIEASRTK